MTERRPIAREHGLAGHPRQGLVMATLGFFAGLTTIVFYGAAGPVLEEHLALTGVLHGLLLGSPHLSKAILRIPFGAWVDKAGGRTPMLVLLASTLVGTAGLVVTLFLTYPHDFDMGLYPVLVLFGFLAGAGGATFSVGITQTSYWYPRERQGFAMGAFAGAGNVSPGLIVFALPLLIGAWGIAWAYSAWLALIGVVTAAYWLLAVDPYYFQLRRQGRGEAEAREAAEDAGQELFPAGNAWDSLRASATNPRTWALVFLYTVSFGGGFTALSAWYPTYWSLFHGLTPAQAGLMAGVFIVYGSLIRIPGGSVSDRFGGEPVAVASFATMALGAALITFATGLWPAFLGMMVLGTGMGVANAAVFELVPKYVPDAVGGASGWISGVGGAGTLVILPALGLFVDAYGAIGYARGFAVFVALSVACAGVALALRWFVAGSRAAAGERALH